MIKKALSRVRRRIRLLRGVKGFFWGLSVGAAFCLALVAASFLTPIERLPLYLAWAFSPCAPLFALVGLLLPVPVSHAASKADSLGLKERARTALLYEGQEGAMLSLQRGDALHALSTLPVRSKMPVAVDRKPCIAAASAALLSAGLLLLPNPQHDILRTREKTHRMLHEQAEMVEAAAEAIPDQEMTEAERRRLRQITEEMAAGVREAANEREALETIGEKQTELEKLQKDMGERMAKDAARAMAQQQGLEAMAEALESGDAAKMEAARAEMTEQLSNEDLAKELGEALESAADELPEGALKDALEAAAAMALSGNAAGAAQMLYDLANATMLSGVNLSTLAQLARAGLLSGSLTPGVDGALGLSALAGLGMAGSGGSQAGRGSTNTDIGYTPGYTQSKQGEGEGETRYRLGMYERIYDPSRLGGDADPSQVTGQKNEGEITQLELGPGMGDIAGTVPYTQVVGEYQDAAAQAMQRQTLPAAMQEWVNRYFDALVD